jgi:hypothetical protein
MLGNVVRWSTRTTIDFLEIKPDGSFKIILYTRRGGCSFEGKLEFMGDTRSKLPLGIKLTNLRNPEE